MASMMYAAASRRKANQFTTYAVLLAIPTSLYGARVLAEGATSEYALVASRFLMILVIAAVAFVVTERDIDYVIRKLLTGGILLATLALVIGVTGVYFLEPVRPSRTLGIELPFFKTAGVPRSFGEQGILISILLAYVLVYWADLGRLRRYTASAAILALIAFGQSRNILLASVIVVVAAAVARARRYGLLAAVLLGAALATFLVGALLPVISSSTIGSALIGEGIYEENVLARFSLREAAIDLISSDPFGAALGYTHEEWGVHYATSTGAEEGVHNHLLASLLFLGLPAGLFSLWLMFWRPAAAILQQLHGNLAYEDRRRRHFILVALAGTLTSLSFYEGFFSLFLAFQVGIMIRLAFASQRRAESHLR
jgi:hypothetical protein